MYKTKYEHTRANHYLVAELIRVLAERENLDYDTATDLIYKSNTFAYMNNPYTTYPTWSAVDLYEEYQRIG